MALNEGEGSSKHSSEGYGGWRDTGGDAGVHPAPSPHPPSGNKVTPRPSHPPDIASLKGPHGPMKTYLDDLSGASTAPVTLQEGPITALPRVQLFSSDQKSRESSPNSQNKEKPSSRDNTSNDVKPKHEEPKSPLRSISSTIKDHPHPAQTYIKTDGEEEDLEGNAPPDPSNMTYGWGSFRPKCLQFLNRPGWVVFFLCMAIVAESMATIGLVSITISTLEKRFQLSSNEAGLIPSAYECAGLPALIISGYFGGKGHRPRWIAMGMLLLSLGSLLFVLPHFLTDPYRYDQASHYAGKGNICNANQSASADSSCSHSSLEEDLSHYLYIFMAGHTLHGVGGVPLYTLSLTYIDDIAPRGTASVYIGVILSLTTLGPAIAFVGAGYLLELYTDIDVVDVSTLNIPSSDPRWVGAWWIGFLVTFTLALTTVIPLAGFPRDMPGAEEHRKKRIKEAHDTGDGLDIPGVAGVGLTAKEFPRAVTILLRNPTFMFLTMVGSFSLFFLAGFGTFEPKYMENQFHVSPATAGIITGLLGVPGGAVGSILASVLIKRLKMTSTQMLKWMFLLTMVSIFLNVIFLVQCDNVPFAGVNQPYNSSESAIKLDSPCNEHCSCSELTYEPVCGSNNVLYYSPCHAGCDGTDSSGQYSGCMCIPGNMTFVQSEPCPVSCNLLPLYSVLFFFGIMLAYVTAMFHLLAVIRVVPESQRSFAVSIDWFLSRLLGGILGPVAFGSMLDLTCVLWQRKCKDSGSCLFYENGSMGWYIFCMANVCLIACAFSSFMAWWKYKPPSRGNSQSHCDEANTTTDQPDTKCATSEMNGTAPLRRV